MPAAVANLLCTRYVIDKFGLAAFVDFQLMTVACLLVIALGDMGVGGAATMAIAGRGADDPHTKAVLCSAFLTLLRVMLTVEVVNIVVTVTGNWHAVLGSMAASDRQIGLAIGLLAMCIPLGGLAQGILLGVGRSHVIVGLGGVYPILMLAGVAAIGAAGLNGTWLVAIPSITLALLEGMFAWAALRSLGVGPMNVWRAVTREGARLGVAGIAVPKFLISVTAALTLQLDRIVLNHVSTAEQVAIYAVSSQLFAPVLSLLIASTVPLWPMYERERSRGRTGPSVLFVSIAFSVATILVCAPMFSIAGPLSDVVSGSRVHVGPLVAAAWSGMIVGQAVAVVVASSVMNTRGIKVVAAWGVASILPNLLASILLAGQWGAPGPLVASAAVTLVMQTVPFVLYRRWTTIKRPIGSRS